MVNGTCEKPIHLYIRNPAPRKLRCITFSGVSICFWDGSQGRTASPRFRRARFRREPSQHITSVPALTQKTVAGESLHVTRDLARSVVLRLVVVCGHSKPF